jgi:hypothetical protein
MHDEHPVPRGGPSTTIAGVDITWHHPRLPARPDLKHCAMDAALTHPVGAPVLAGIVCTPSSCSTPR